MRLVPVVGGHVVVGHVAQLVDVRHAERLAGRAARVGQGRPVDVPVAAVGRVALRRLVQPGVVLRAHRVVPARILRARTTFTETENNVYWASPQTSPPTPFERRSWRSPSSLTGRSRHQPAWTLACVRSHDVIGKTGSTGTQHSVINAAENGTTPRRPHVLGKGWTCWRTDRHAHRSTLHPTPELQCCLVVYAASLKSVR